MHVLFTEVIHVTKLADFVYVVEVPYMQKRQQHPYSHLIAGGGPGVHVRGNHTAILELEAQPGYYINVWHDQTWTIRSTLQLEISRSSGCSFFSFLR